MRTFNITLVETKNYFRYTNDDFKSMRNYILASKFAHMSRFQLGSAIDALEEIRDMKVGEVLYISSCKMYATVQKSLSFLQAQYRDPINDDWEFSAFDAFKVKKTEKGWLLYNIGYEVA